MLAGGLWLVPTGSLAQNTAEPPPATNTPAPATVGPQELQNFRLPGTTTRPADQQPAAPATVAPAQADGAGSPEAEVTVPSARRLAAPPHERKAATAAPSPIPAPPPASTVDLSAVPQEAPVTAAPAPSFDIPSASLSQSPVTDGASVRSLSLLPWLLAAVILAAGIGFLLWRRRPREAAAGAANFELFEAAEPAAGAPRPAPASAIAPKPLPPPPLPPVPTPPKPAAPASGGIIASRLRPALQIGVHPLRCVIGDDQVAIEFELELFNAGAAPARAVLAEASLLNAGSTQDQELGAFFSNPVGDGPRIDAIPPMKRVTLTSQVLAPREAIQEYELAGRKAFVPVIAFNALYEWSGGNGQTSEAYLVGRKTSGDKLGPLRLDAGSREFRSLSARPLPTMVRT